MSLRPIKQVLETKSTIEGAAQLYSCPFHGRLRLDDPLDGSNGHDAS